MAYKIKKDKKKYGVRRYGVFSWTTNELIDEIEKAWRSSWAVSKIERYIQPMKTELKKRAKKGDEVAKKYAIWEGFYDYD
jgi:hypothetical protein